MDNKNFVFGDSEWDLLVKILEKENEMFDRLQQILSAIAGADLTTENSNITGINGVAPSVGCGVATTGTLRVAQATDCAVAIGSVAPGNDAAQLGKSEDAVHASGDVGVFSLGVSNEVQSVRNADGDYSIMATDTKGNSLVVGNLAHDAVDAGFPVKMGFQARTTIPTAVADGDRVNGIADKFGRQIMQHAIRDLRGNQNTTITASTAETTIVTAEASNMLDIYLLTLTNTSATATNVTIRDATAGTTRFIFAIPAGETRGFALPACDGHKQAAINNNWTAQSSASISSLVITALFSRNTS